MYIQQVDYAIKNYLDRYEYQSIIKQVESAMEKFYVSNNAPASVGVTINTMEDLDVFFKVLTRYLESYGYKVAVNKSDNIDFIREQGMSLDRRERKYSITIAIV